MGLVSSNLNQKYGVKPVHSSDEIKRLADEFPENIQLYVSLSENNQMIAGVVIYETKTVAHTQYIASNEEGRNQGALDILFDHLILYYSDKKRFFDFGISTENNGHFLNMGLIEQKEGFGGRATTYEHYMWDLGK
jgi:lipid II:glycine glycyltransferase (peptidoglycan interpeptide bridge formation enzyme)